MDSIKINHKNTKIIAHRGLSGIETENTSSAFIAAGNRSYFGIETDVHVTKDNQYIIIHDDNPKRVSGIDCVVENTDIADLKKIHLFEKETDLIRSDLVLPYLWEYSYICKKYGKVSVLELKNPMKKENVADIINIVDKTGQLENTIFISFDYQNLIYVREILPSAQIQYLVSEFTPELIGKLKKYSFDIDIYYKPLTKEIISALHSENIKVNTWTCNDKETAEKFISWGIDFITTNILE